jgi:hypothetical protein
MVRLLGRKIPNSLLIGAAILLALRSPSRFSQAAGAVGSIGNVFESLGSGLDTFTRGVLPFDVLGTEFTQFSGGINSLLDPIERLIDIGGRLLPFSVPPVGAIGGRELLVLPPDEPVPQGTPTPKVEIYGEVY